MLEQKLLELTNMIIADAAKLGLVFVNGPDTAVWSPPAPPTVNLTNGQARGVFQFGVAEG